MTSMPKYSIVVPLHNEQENVTDLYDRLKAVMEAHPGIQNFLDRVNGPKGPSQKK